MMTVVTRAARQKSVTATFWLTLLLGPFGAFYVSVSWGLIWLAIFVLALFIPGVSFLVAIPFLVFFSIRKIKTQNAALDSTINQ
jgi:hypothetical protein